MVIRRSYELSELLFVIAVSGLYHVIITLGPSAVPSPNMNIVKI